jgi:hypothetical protein
LFLAVNGYKEEKEEKGMGESLKRFLFIHIFLTFVCFFSGCVVFLVVLAFLENACKRLF